MRSHIWNKGPILSPIMQIDLIKKNVSVINFNLYNGKT